MTAWAYTRTQSTHDRRPSSAVSLTREALAVRLAGLRPHARPIGIVLAVNAAALAVAAVLWVAFGVKSISEDGPLNALNSAQLLGGGAFAVAAFIAASRSGSGRANRDQFVFWALVGVGLVLLGIDDVGGLHERLGHGAGNAAGSLPLLTNHPDDAITLGYAAAGLAVLGRYRRELMAPRAESSVLLAGATMSFLMVVTDAYAFGPLRGLEYPVQGFAVALLFLAGLVRYREARAAGGA